MKRSIGQSRTADDDPVDPMQQQRLDEFFLPLAVFDDIGEQQIVAGGTCRVLGARMTSGKNGLVMSGTRRPMVFDRSDRSPRAKGLGR